MTRKIPDPSQRKWNKANNSDLFGNVYITKQISFDEEGYLKLSGASKAIMDTTVDSDFDDCADIVRSDDHGYLAITWDNIFDVEEDILSETPTQNVDPGVPSTDDQSDAEWFGGLLVVSQDTDVDYYDPSTNVWTDTNISLTNDGQHPLTNFLSFNYLAVADVNTVKLYSSPLTATPTLVRTLTIPSDYQITSMVYFNQNLYIGTVSKYGPRAQLFVWNGEGSAAQSAFKVDSNIIFDVCVFQDTIVCFIGDGSLQRFNGTGFSFIDAFPVYYLNRPLTDELNINIRKNCMRPNGDSLYISFSDTENDTHQLLNMPSGIWCYDPKVGLYHKYSFSNSRVYHDLILTTDVNTGTDTIVVSVAPPTGTEVYYRANGSTVLEGLADETKYYVIKVDSTHIKLATTLVNALAGTVIDLTGTGSLFQTLVFFPKTDYGQFVTGNPFTVLPISIPRRQLQYGVDVIWSADVGSRTIPLDNIETMGSISEGVESRGYFVTPKIYSSQVTDTFNKIVLKYAPFMSEHDRIILKYRLTDDGLNEINLSNSTFWKITWTSDTTFTTTDTHYADAIVGDEIEVLAGAAGGLLAHITAISNNAGTYTVTIDETFNDYTSGDISTAIFKNWKKWATITPDDTDVSDNDTGLFEQQLGETGKFIQFKIEMRGIGIKIEEFQVDDIYQLPSTH